MANETTMTIVGNLTADPELRFTPAGVALCKFTVASTPRVFDKAAGEYRDADPLFLTCTVWRQMAEHTAESLTKGARVVVVGRLRLSRWETPEGEKRSAYGLDVDEVGPSLRFATAAVKKLSRNHANGPDDPWATATNTPTPATAPVPAAAGGAGGFDDEPPF